MRKDLLRNKGIKFNLQFFADESGNGSEGGNENTDEKNGGSDESGEQDDDSGKEDEKTFTQSEVSRLMAKEKKEGKKSILKSLGFNSEKEAQDAFNLLKALKDSQKTAEEKAKENEGKASKEKEDAEQRAMMAEMKLSCFTSGVNKDSIDDVLAIATLKISDDKDLDDVLKEMKKDKRYASFFSNGSSSEDGTGNPPGHSGTGKKTEKNANWEYGKRLAEANKKDNSKKTSYFS